MKPLLAIPTILLALNGCASVLAREQPWSFVASVGGLEVGTPVHRQSRWELPVRADVSGLQAITHAPTAMNSGLVCDAVKAHIKGREIYLALTTTVLHRDAS